MTFAEALQLFKENVNGATSLAPDNYPEWDTAGWTTHRRDLLHYWSEVRPHIVHDTDRRDFIDDKLTQAVASFDRGEREPGQSLMVQVYNVLNLHTLR
jgi:hypothetical protein